MARGNEYFKWEGGPELEAALKALADAAGSGRDGKAAMRRAGLTALEPFAKTAAADAPILSGNLSMSFKTGTRLTRRQAALAKKAPKSGVEVYAGTANPAGQMQEFGTAFHPAQPFAREAWDKTQLLVLNVFSQEAWKELAKTAQRMARRLAKRS